MKKRTKVLPFLLASTMVLSATGCTSTGNDSGTSNSGNIPELTYWAIGDQPKELDAVTAAINEYTVEKIGAKVKFKYAGWGDYSDKISKIIQSGEAYDIAFGAAINNSTDLAEKGYFADLAPVLNDKAKALYDFVPTSLWEAMTLEGKIFGVPAYKDSAQANYWVWKKSVVDELGIDYENIETLDELYPALQKIKQAYPSDYPIMIHGKEGINSLESDFDLFLELPMIGVKYDDPSAKVTTPFADEQYLGYLRTLYKWMKEGLINPDAASLTQNINKGVVASGQGYPTSDVEWSITNEYPVVSHRRTDPIYTTKSIRGSFMVVSANSPNIEKSTELLQLINTDSKMRNLLAFGIEDTHYKKTGENNIEMLTDGYRTAQFSQGTFFNMYIVDPAPANRWELLKQQNEEAIESPILGFSFSSKNVQNEIAACSTIFNKYKSVLITGTEDPDVKVPQMMEELNKAGLQTIIDDSQKQIDEFLANKK